MLCKSEYIVNNAKLRLPNLLPVYSNALMTALNSRSGSSVQVLGRTDVSHNSAFQWQSFSSSCPENNSTSAAVIHIKATSDASDGEALSMKVRESPLASTFRFSPTVCFTKLNSDNI